MDFINEHKAIIWVIFVILTYFLLQFTTRKTMNFLTIKSAERNGSPNKVYNILRRVISIFLTVFGLGLISYVFFEKGTYAVISENLQRVIFIALMIVATIISAAISQNYFERKIRESSRRDAQDPTTYKFLNYLASFAIYLVGFSLAAMAIPVLRSLAASMLAGAGVLALVAGVAAQEGISNLVGGLFIVFFKPYRIGDVIKVGDKVVGRVEDLNLRHTVINNFENKRVVIPNATMNKEQIINYYLTEYKNCEWVEIGISYDSNIDKAMEIMREEALKHPYFFDNRTTTQKENNVSPIDVQVIGLGDSSVNLRAWVWAASYQTGFKMRNELYKNIKQRFDQEGIEIPFPHRTVVIKKSATTNH